MTGRRGAALYTPELLGLALELAHYPLSDDLPVRAEARARLCGSRAEIGLALSQDGTISRAGARMTACAMGQAAAAVFLRSAPGNDAKKLAAALAQLESWLGDKGEAPSWPDVAILAPARDHPARHAAMLLPWKAALAALSNPVSGD